MSDKLPIDYARARLDVVRKKFRRRVVWFVIATVVVMVISGGWMWSMSLPSRRVVRLIDLESLGSLDSLSGTIVLKGPPNAYPQTAVPGRRGNVWKVGFGQYTPYYWNRTLGIEVHVDKSPGSPKWRAHIRYRTLFILTTIPWIIILIRMIRIRRRMHRFETA